MFNNFLNSFSDPTTNGSNLSAVGFGANQNLGVSGSGFNPVGSGGFTGLSQTGLAAQGVNVAPAQTGGFGNFFKKGGGASMALAGVQTLGNLWNSYQAHKMAKKQFNFAREQWDTNLANQTQSYNTALEDRIRARHAYSGKDEGATQEYLDKHSL